jgi:hypothetical protein
MKHGLYKDANGKKSRLYHIWEDMKSRCNNPNNRRYKDYGGRGIKVCHDWQVDFRLFSNWAINNGYADNLTIDRINVEGDYEPGNCRWSTKKLQSNNRRDNRYITFKGTTRTLTQWAEIKGFKPHVLKNRLNRGWSVNRALTTPLMERRKCSAS